MFVLVVALAGGAVFYFRFLAPQSHTLPPQSSPPQKSEPPSGNKVLPSQSALPQKPKLLTGDTSLPEQPQVTPEVPSYPLPLDLASVVNMDAVQKKTHLSAAARQLLAKNGFVVTDFPPFVPQKEYFLDAYDAIKRREIPIFVTSDSLLHYAHVFFDTALSRAEEEIFYNDIWEISKRLLDDNLALSQNADDPAVKAAAKKNIAYVSVALALLQPKKEQIISEEQVERTRGCGYLRSEEMRQRCRQSESYQKLLRKGDVSLFGTEEAARYAFQVPPMVQQAVAEELRQVEAHKGQSCSPIFSYIEDYSQYVPRGHYTKSEKLKNYFKAVMWYGRMTDILHGSPNLKKGTCQPASSREAFLSEEDAKEQTLAALLLARKFANDQEMRRRWERLYAVTSFFVGFSDDLGPVEYAKTLRDVMGEEDAAAAGKIAKNLAKIMEALKALPSPKIYSGLGNAVVGNINDSGKEVEQMLDFTKGFRLLGQRYTVDSYLFSKLVGSYTGSYTGPADKKPFTYTMTAMGPIRGFPRGLDIMALFGSDRAKTILHDLGDASYHDYEKQFQKLQGELRALPEEQWHRNLYWTWLDVLKSLLGAVGKGYPTFMQTTAWQDKELHTALASWAELRHDTILYVKQSYTATAGSIPPQYRVEGYVEPVPQLYSKLSRMMAMLQGGITRLFSQDEQERLGIAKALDRFLEILSRLTNIANKELQNKVLTDEDYQFIKYFAGSLQGINNSLFAGHRVEEDKNTFKTSLVADVHTDGNSGNVLEEGVGQVKMLVAAYPMPDGGIVVGAGPVFSYYEFKQPMAHRLTDEDWRAMLAKNPPAPPAWTKTFMEQSEAPSR